MINFLDFMQRMFGKAYPLFASAAFGALAVYYAAFYETNDRTPLTLLAGASSLGWLCLHECEVVLGKVVTAMESATALLEAIISNSLDDEAE